MLAALPEITAACLNALLVAMMGSSTSIPEHEEFTLSIPASAPASASALAGMKSPPPTINFEMIGVLKRNFGNRTTELLGVMSANGNSITQSAKKQNFLMAQDLQMGLLECGFEISIQDLKAQLEATLGKAEPLWLSDL